MEYEMINELNAERMRKRIKIKDIAMAVNISEAYVSMYFKHKANNIDSNKEQAIIEYVRSQPEYRMAKIIVEN
ncbi:hypothetical protein [Bacillus norwichensis]|uniref:XRE family transcriptional regulator n=1 Tax=Bacillus norwichensis TaxID=2762217 RepID=A0ABR8VIH2_9BACI|nr:hypothetical protein [Bacillus norwichensis]MBD8004549.1 hypothetical protein [Bacillus norwichensis]